MNAWECISLVTIKGTTLDFVIIDPEHMMTLLSFLCKKIYKLKNDTEWKAIMRVYQWLKFKMKLGFECHTRKIEIREVVIGAIIKTI
jgi:hypothetical protein